MEHSQKRNVGGSSPHSFYICFSPEMLVSKVGHLDLIPSLTKGSKHASTASQVCKPSYQVTLLQLEAIVRHVSGCAKDQVNSSDSESLFLSLERSI